MKTYEFTRAGAKEFAEDAKSMTREEIDSYGTFSMVVIAYWDSPEMRARLEHLYSDGVSLGRDLLDSIRAHSVNSRAQEFRSRFDSSSPVAKTLAWQVATSTLAQDQILQSSQLPQLKIVHALWADGILALYDIRN